MRTITFCLPLFFATIAQGQVSSDTCSASPAIVYFGNGILNTHIDAILATKKLGDAVRAKTLASVEFCLAYDSEYQVVQGGFINLPLQLLDAMEQEGLQFSSQLLTWITSPSLAPPSLQNIVLNAIEAANAVDLSTRPDLQAQEANYNDNLLAGGKVVVVAHSQGNLYVNQAYRDLAPNPSDFHVIAVATPADYVAGGGPWSTLANDIVTLVPGALTDNEYNTNTPGFCNPPPDLASEINCHSFIDSYLAGNNSGSRILNEIILNIPTGPTWTQLITSGTVMGREDPSSVYDPSTNSLILFGGLSVQVANTPYNDVWVLSNANGLGVTPQWTQLSPSAPSGFPPARSNQSAIYDPATNRMIIFGGAVGSCGGFCTLFNDTWVLTNANGVGGTPTWVPLAPAGGPPAAREGHRALYDNQNNRMIIFGGGNDGAADRNDVWVLSNANGLGGTPTWTQLSPGGPLPSGREHFAAGYDPNTNRMIVFGGCCYWTNDSWVLENANGLGATPQWTQLSPTGTLPGIRETPAFGYDPAGNYLLIFGIGAAGAVYNDTWSLSDANGVGSTDQWADLIPNGSPNAPPVISGFNTASASSYDPANRRLIILKNAPLPGGGTALQTWVLSSP